MIKIFLAISLLIVVLFGYGKTMMKLLKLEKEIFAVPIGFVTFFCVLQLFYYPVQFFNLSFNLIIVITTVLLILGIILAFLHLKEVKVSKYWLFVVLSIFVYLGVFYFCFIDIEFSDSPMYLNYIAQNINNSTLNKFDLYSGLVGQEWDGLYLYQSYYHFASYLCWMINIPYYLLGSSGYVENIAISTWGLGLLYNVLSSMITINIIAYLKFDNKYFKYVVLLFTLLFSNFYYWRVVLAFYGNTYRTILITMLMFYSYRFVNDENEKLKYLMMLIVGAGIACSSSFLFISFSVLICLCAYLFSNKRSNAFKDMAIIVLPIAIYASVMFYKSNKLIGMILAIVFLIYYLFKNTYIINNICQIIEKFLFKYAKIIFFVFLPLLLIAYSFYLNVTDDNLLIDYAYALQDHQQYDMVKDYTFRYSGIIDNCLNIIRWLGVAMVIYKAHTNGDRYIKYTFVLMLLLFLNPLCASGLAQTIASNVFYRNVEALFNPFTESLLLLCIIDNINNKYITMGISAVLLFSTVLGHALSFVDSDDGLYTFYVNGGKEVDHIYKIEHGEYEVIKRLQEELANDPIDGQPIVISQANGMRTFIPNAYQPITTRDFYYPYNRIDWNFYEIVRKHYPWQEHVDTPYENTCMYLERYDIDYLIIKYWDNPEFDQASDACSITIFESAEFKLKKVK